MKKQQDAGADEVRVGLYNKKSNVDRLADPLGFRFVFEKDRTFVEAIDVRDTPELAGQVALKERMARALRHGALAAGDLAEELEADPQTVARIARRYDGKLFMQLAGPDGKKRIGLVRQVSADSVRTVSGTRTDTRGLFRAPVSAAAVGRNDDEELGDELLKL